MRVLFLGNHTVGVRTLQTIGETEEVVGVVAHPADPEDGVRYESVSDLARQNGWSLIRCPGRDPRLVSFVRDSRPDLLWITDYRYLLPSTVISLASRGVVNLHPSLLPKYRGRASLNWAILNGETSLGLTAHFVDAGMDSGDIIAQMSFELREDQDVGDALTILYPLYSEATRTVLCYFRSGRVPRKPQDHSQATSFPRRRPEDGLIDWTAPARTVRNLVRGVALPYPGAFTTFGGRKLLVWKAALPPVPLEQVAQPGTVIAVDGDTLTVQCADGPLLVTSFECADEDQRAHLRPGVVLGDWAASVLLVADPSSKCSGHGR